MKYLSRCKYCGRDFILDDDSTDVTCGSPECIEAYYNDRNIINRTSAGESKFKPAEAGRKTSKQVKKAKVTSSYKNIAAIDITSGDSARSVEITDIRPDIVSSYRKKFKPRKNKANVEGLGVKNETSHQEEVKLSVTSSVVKNEEEKVSKKSGKASKKGYKKEQKAGSKDSKKAKRKSRKG